MSNFNLELNDLTAEPRAKDVTKFRLDEINKIKDYLNAEIKDRKDIIKKISKYIVAFDYADELFITFYCIACDNCWNICRNSWSIFNCNIYRTTGIVKKLLNITRKKKKKHNKIIALARGKLNIIETLISQALIDVEISHEELSKIIYEKNNYEQIRDNIRSVKSINDLNKEND